MTAISTHHMAAQSLCLSHQSLDRRFWAKTAAKTNVGRGTCVGGKFSGIDWRIIRIRDDAVDQIGDCEECQRARSARSSFADLWLQPNTSLGQIKRHCKTSRRRTFWHRIGDVGYLDAADRFWFCGRKAHRVQTSSGTMFTIPCEAIFNQHHAVYRSALVGVGRPGEQSPVMICEPWPEHRPKTDEENSKLLAELHTVGQASELTSQISARHVLLHDSLPVDIRHNSKIFREKLSVWPRKSCSPNS